MHTHVHKHTCAGGSTLSNRCKDFTNTGAACAELTALLLPGRISRICSAEACSRSSLMHSACGWGCVCVCVLRVPCEQGDKIERVEVDTQTARAYSQHTSTRTHTHLLPPRNSRGVPALRCRGEGHLRMKVRSDTNVSVNSRHS